MSAIKKNYSEKRLKINRLMKEQYNNFNGTRYNKFNEEQIKK